METSRPPLARMCADTRTNLRADLSRLRTGTDTGVPMRSFPWASMGEDLPGGGWHTHASGQMSRDCKSNSRCPMTMRGRETGLLDELYSSSYATTNCCCRGSKAMNIARTCSSVRINCSFNKAISVSTSRRRTFASILATLGFLYTSFGVAGFFVHFFFDLSLVTQPRLSKSLYHIYDATRRHCCTPIHYPK